MSCPLRCQRTGRTRWQARCINPPFPDGGLRRASCGPFSAAVWERLVPMPNSTAHTITGPCSLGQNRTDYLLLNRTFLFVANMPLGGGTFPGKAFSIFPEKTGFTEIPRVQRFALRPSLEKLFSEGQPKPRRNKAIATAHIGHGYSQQSIAAHLGLHYATVSRIIKKERDTSKSKT